MITRGTGNKAYENFKLRMRRDTHFPMDIFFLPSATLALYSATLPSGVLVYDTDNNNLKIGLGASWKTITQS